MRLAYFDCFAGISGDMILGALLDAGLSVDALRGHLSALPLDGCRVEVQKVVRLGTAGTRVRVVQTPVDAGAEVQGRMRGRTGDTALPARLELPVEALVSESALPAIVKEASLAVFSRLRQAESRLHGDVRAQEPPELDGFCSLVEIVGTIAGLSLMGIDRVECSPVNIGQGLMQTDAGVVPVLAPEAAEILRAASAPIYGSSLSRELVTPVGAALITALASAYGPVPTVRVDSLGYGIGHEEHPDGANVLRLIVGERAGTNAVSVTTMPVVAQGYAPDGDGKWLSIITDGHQQSGRQRTRGR